MRRRLIENRGGVLPDSGVIENDIEFNTVRFAYQDLNNPIDAWWATSRNGSFADFLDDGSFYNGNVDISYTPFGYVNCHKYEPRFPVIMWTIPKGIYSGESGDTALNFGINSSTSGVFFRASICELSHLKRTTCRIEGYSYDLDCYLDSYDENNNNNIEGCNGINQMYGLHIEEDVKGILTSEQIRNIFGRGFSFSTYILPDINEMIVVIE